MENTDLPVIQVLIGQREVLEGMRVTTRDIDQETLSPGVRLTLRIYLQILDDGLSVLHALLTHLTVHG